MTGFGSAGGIIRLFSAAAGLSARPCFASSGLSRNGRDFHVLAEALSQSFDGARDVYTLDYRGRGQSEYDKNWRNYAVPARSRRRAGLHDRGRAQAARHHRHVTRRADRDGDGGPSAARGRAGGVERHRPRDRAEGPWAHLGIRRAHPVARNVGRKRGRCCRTWSERSFPNLGTDEWIEVARQWFNEHKGRPAPGYDPALANALSVLDGPIPQLWPQFEGLKRVPVLVLRGENSDILSEETVEMMHRRHPQLSSYIVPGEGPCAAAARRTEHPGRGAVPRRQRGFRMAAAVGLRLRRLTRGCTSSRRRGVTRLTRISVRSPTGTAKIADTEPVDAAPVRKPRPRGGAARPIVERRCGGEFVLAVRCVAPGFVTARCTLRWPVRLHSRAPATSRRMQPGRLPCRCRSRARGPPRRRLPRPRR